MDLSATQQCVILGCTFLVKQIIWAAHAYKPNQTNRSNVLIAKTNKKIPPPKKNLVVGYLGCFGPKTPPK